MGRINVYAYPTEDDYDSNGPTLAGWFDSDKADRIEQDTYWNGNNHLSVHTRSYGRNQELYRTSGGRWVLGHYSSWQGEVDRYEFVDDARAREWLTVNNSDDLIEKYFGSPLEEKAGPAPTGRPKEFADPYPQRLTPAMQAEVDRLAKEASVGRAEMVRRLVEAGLAGQGPWARRAGQE